MALRQYLRGQFTSTRTSLDHPTYTGKHVSFRGINAYPRPVQKPYLPFVIGGRSEGAYRRTARYAHGWYGFNSNLEQTRAEIASMAQAVERLWPAV